MLPTRRNLLRLALLGGPALYLSSRLAPASWARDSSPSSPPAVPFQSTLPRPLVLNPVSPDILPGVPRFSDPTDYYLVTQRQAPVAIFPSGPATTVWGYQGLYPGPTIVAQRNRRVVVRQVNLLNVPNTAVTHLHGGHTPPDSDGAAFTEDEIPLGGFRDYVYPNDNPVACTLFYHDHFLDFTGRNVAMGLAGAYLIQDEFEHELVARGALPGPDYDYPLLLQDRLFTADNQLFYSPFNGAIQPRLKVANRRYRFRIVNGSNARYYGLALSSGEPLTVIGGDQGLLPQAVQVQSLVIAPAERYEVVIDFSRLPVPSQLVLNNCLPQDNGRGPDAYDPDKCVPLLRFDVEIDHPEISPQPIPDPLRDDLPVALEEDAVTTRHWEFNRSDGAWQVNGQFYDENRVDARPVLGTTEVWVLQNGSGGWFHPIHIHDEHFHILDRNGDPPLPQETGLKDTVNLNPNDEVRVLIKWTGENNVGKYVMHCHNTEHEDMRMMVRFDVVRG